MDEHGTDAARPSTGMVNARRLAFATCITTVALIALGAAVRATGSGLGCPDWPLCHGGVVPPGERHSLIEFSHRLLASVVGLMVIGTAVMAWRYYRQAPLVTWLAVGTVALVGLQGLIGAVTVVRELPPEIVASHLLMAMVVLGCELTVALGMHLETHPRQQRRGVARGAGPLPAMVIVALAWLACLMWVGAYMAESGASTACSGWPGCNGSLLPTNDDQEIVHMIHRYLAAGLGLILIGVAAIAWKRRREFAGGRPLAASLAVVYIAQVLVGALNLWFTFPDALAVVHTALASIIWVLLAGTIVVAYYAPAARRVVRPRPAEVLA